MPSTTSTTTSPSATTRPSVVSTAADLRRRYQQWLESWSGLTRKLTANGLHPEAISALRHASFLSYFPTVSWYAPPFLRRGPFATNSNSDGTSESDGDDVNVEERDEPHSGGQLLANMGGSSYNDLREFECTVGDSGGVGGRSNGIGNTGARVVYDSSFRRCCVCLGEYVEGEELRILPCAHALHGKCARKWLRVESVCPYCRAEVGGLEVRGGRRIPARSERDSAAVELIDYSVTISWSEWIRGFMWDGNTQTE